MKKGKWDKSQTRKDLKKGIVLFSDFGSRTEWFIIRKIYPDSDGNYIISTFYFGHTNNFKLMDFYPKHYRMINLENATSAEIHKLVETIFKYPIRRL